MDGTRKRPREDSRDGPAYPAEARLPDEQEFAPATTHRRLVSDSPFEDSIQVIEACGLATDEPGVPFDVQFQADEEGVLYVEYEGEEVDPRESGSDGSGQAGTMGTKGKRRGRKNPDQETVRREARLAADWKQAKESDVYKGDFAKGIGMAVKDFDRLLDRVAARNRRSDK